MVVIEIGGLYGWGSNTSYIFGKNDVEHYEVATLVRFDELKKKRLVNVAAGMKHAVFLDGKLILRYFFVKFYIDIYFLIY